MNYLGHIYLSGNNELLMVGNFIGDYVKGNRYNNYPEPIRQGICFTVPLIILPTKMSIGWQ